MLALGRGGEGSKADDVLFVAFDDAKSPPPPGCSFVVAAAAGTMERSVGTGDCSTDESGVV